MKNKKINIESLEKSSVYQVPDGYFNDLTYRIQTKVNKDKESRGRSVVLSTRIQLSIAASLVVVLLSILWIIPSDQLGKNQDPLAEFSSAEIVEYLAYENVSIYDIASQTAIDDLLEDVQADYNDITQGLSAAELDMFIDEIDLTTEL